MTVSAFPDGAALTPHFAAYNTPLGSEYYRKNILANDVLPKIRATVLGCAEKDAAKHRMLLRRLALPHAAARATRLPRKDNVRGPP